MLPNPSLQLSGERFRVTYLLMGSEAEAREKAAAICLEQTVEFPDELTPPGDIRQKVVGRVESFGQALPVEPLSPAGPAESFSLVRPERWEAVISYAAETVGGELTQLLNVIFGNSSIKPSIRVQRLDLPETMLAEFRGPRFGREGLREYLNVRDRPLLCTALKPMGLSAADLAELTYQFALGGIDIIKDDHGLADQPFAPFEERVALCAEAVQRANRETGRRSIYMPNVSAPADRIVERALFARRMGAGGLLVSPGLVGMDAMRMLADDDRVALPIMSHPALQGSFVTSPESGISHGALFGQIARLAGADATIFPNYGGRFAFSKAECQSIADATRAPLGAIRPIFPAPGGGMSLECVPDMLQLYGRDVIFLIGGGLFRAGSDLVKNCRYFLGMIS